MRIDFERSGGFTGIPLHRSISSDDLSAEEQEKLTNLVRTAGFFGLPSLIRDPQPGADRFQYKVSIESDQGSHTVQIDEGAVPAQMKPLIKWLQTSHEKH